MKKLISSALCLLLILTLVLPTFGIAIVSITGIAVDKTSVSLGVGDTKVIGITFKPANTTQKYLNFSTSNKNVAAISANGIITAIGAGNAVITIVSQSNSSVKATINVTVKKKAPVSMTIEVFDRATPGQTPVTNNYWTKWIQEKFGDPNNINLKFVACPRSQEVEMLNVWMAANQAPDISFCYDIDTSVIYNFYKKDGLADLTEALNQYGPELKVYLKDTLKYGVFDGKQISIPAKRVMLARTGTWIRKDWLDKLGMPVPTTSDEYYSTLKAFKEKNPAHAGKIVPLSLPNDIGLYADAILESFVKPISEKERYLGYKFFMPGYKDGVRFLNKLYNEGLISKDFALDKDFKMQDQDIISGNAGSYRSNYDQAIRVVPGHLAALKKNIPDAELIPVDPFTNKYTGKYTKQLQYPFGLKVIVPKTSKRVNEVIKYMNWMTGKDVLFFLQNGNEGVGHEIVNGLPKVLAAKGEQMFNSPQNIDYTLIVNGVDLGDDSTNVKASAMSYPGFEALFPDTLKIALNDAFVPPICPVPNDADAKYSKSLLEKEKEIFAKSLTAHPADFDAVYDKLLQEYLRMGGQEVIEQRKLAWKAANK